MLIPSDLIDRNGEIIKVKKEIFKKYSICDRQFYSEGLLPVRIENMKCGYINLKGEVIIEPKFDFAMSFTDGVAFVQNGKLFGLIDKNGDYIIEPKYKKVLPYNEGIALVYDSNKCYSIDIIGNIINVFNANNINPFNEGFAVYGDKIIDKYGNTIVNIPDGLLPYTKIVTEGTIFLVNDLNQFFIFNMYGQIVKLEACIINVKSFSEGLAAIQIYDNNSNENKWGYINIKGDITIVPNSFFNVGNFKEGKAVVIKKITEDDFEIGFINYNGKIISPMISTKQIKPTEYHDGIYVLYQYFSINP